MKSLFTYDKNRHRKITILKRAYDSFLFFNSACIILDLKMESPNVIKKFTCEICEKGFSNKYYKDQHISTVHGEVKNLECNVCSKAFGKN